MQLFIRNTLRTWLFLIVLAGLSTGARAQLLTDDFNATTLPYSLTLQGWTAHSGGGTNSISASAPGLTYAGLTTAGGAAGLTTTGEDVHRTFTSQSSGSVYASFLLAVSAAQATGDYFIHFGGTTIGNTFNNRVYVRSATGGFQFGLAKGNEIPTYNSTIYALNTTYFVALKYTLVSGTANDVVNLFVDPVLGQAEPAVTLTQSSTATDLSAVGTIALRQGTTANAPSTRVDYIRVGTTWADVTSGNTPAGPSLSATPTSLTGANGLTYVVGAGPATTPISVSGTNLTAGGGTITATSSSADFTVSPTTATYTGTSLGATNFTVGLVSGLAVGSAYSANITFAGGGATAVVPLSGTVTATVPAPNLSINDVTLAEGNAGTATVSFTVMLSAPAPAGGVTFDIATADGTATTAGSDYVAKSLTGQTIPAGSSTYVFDVLVNGDVTSEINETFFVNVSNVTGANVIDGQGIGTIITDDATLISQIQGSGTAATAGTFTIEGIVVGVFNGTQQLGGYYVQEEDTDSDGNVLTSEGIFVNSATMVNVGDRVRIDGTVQENSTTPSFNQAIITPGSELILSIGQQALVTPTTVSLPTAALGDLERYEGMLVNFNQTLTVTETFSLGRFGEVVLANGRLFTPTNSIDPNDNPATGTSSSGTSNVAAVSAQQNLNDRSRIVLDDGSSASNLADVPYIGGMNPTLRIGSTLATLTGVLGFGFSEYRIQPTVTPTFTYAARPAVPTVGGSVKVGSFNVLNYFNGNGSGSGFPTSRGADTPAEFARQRAKIVTAINQLNADVVGLVEIENDGDGANSAIADLVNGLNASAPGTFTFVSLANTTGTSGTDQIKVAFIYKPATVTPVGTASYFNDAAFNTARPPLAQTFQINAGGGIFTPIINHFKAKGSASSLPGDTDQGDGQALSNATRKAQATALLTFVSQVQTSSGDMDIMVLGDLNAYNEEDPIDILRAGGLTKLTTATDSYVFMGQTGSLDHALVTAGLSAQVTGTAKWNINADEPTALDYNDNIQSSGEASSELRNDTSLFDGNSPFRSSDHDPVLVGLNLTSPAASNSAPVAAMIAPQSATVGQAFSFTVPAFSDPNGDMLTYSASVLPGGLAFDVDTRVISGVPSTTVGSPFSVSVTATDPGNLSATAQFTITVSASATMPVSPTVSPGSFTLVQPTYNCTSGAIIINTTGGNGTTITYTAVGVKREDAGNAGIVEADLRSDPKPLNITATQSGVTVSQVFDFAAFCAGTTSPPAANSAPVAPSVGPQSATVGQAFSFVVPAFSDPNGDALTYSATGLPANGLSFNASTRTISGTPSMSGTVNVTITATDPGMLSASTSFVITISPAGSGSVTPPPSGSFTLTQPTYNCQTGAITFNTTGGDGTAITYTAVGVSRPNNAGNTGTVEAGLRSDPKPLNITATQSGVTVSQVFNFAAFCAGTTSPPGANSAPVAPSVGPQSATVGQAFSFVVPAFSDPNGDALTYSATGLPANGLSFNPANRTISGTPSMTGTVNVTVTATDPGMLSASTSFVITISPAGSGSVTPPAGQPLAVTVVSYNCATGDIVFGRTGGDMSRPVEYQAIGVVNGGFNISTNRRIEDGLRNDANTANRTITLQGRYVGEPGSEVSFTFDFRTACGQARQGIEPAGALQILVLGNPTADETVRVEIRGAEGQAVRLTVLDMQGQQLDYQVIESAGVIEQQTVRLGKTAGVYLLTVSTDRQRKTVKVVR